MTSTRTPHQLPRHGCPVCLHVINAATPTSAEAMEPKPGDLSVCAYCATLLEFDAELRPQQASAATVASLDRQTLRQLALLTRVVQQRVQG